MTGDRFALGDQRVKLTCGCGDPKCGKRVGAVYDTDAGPMIVLDADSREDRHHERARDSDRSARLGIPVDDDRDRLPGALDVGPLRPTDPGYAVELRASCPSGHGVLVVDRLAIERAYDDGRRHLQLLLAANGVRSAPARPARPN